MYQQVLRHDVELQRCLHVTVIILIYYEEIKNFTVERFTTNKMHQLNSFSIARLLLLTWILCLHNYVQG